MVCSVITYAGASDHNVLTLTQSLWKCVVHSGRFEQSLALLRLSFGTSFHLSPASLEKAAIYVYSSHAPRDRVNT